MKAKTDKAALELVRSFRQAVREGDVWVMRFAAECIAECMCRFSFLLILDVSRFPEPGPPVYSRAGISFGFLFSQQIKDPPHRKPNHSNQTKHRQSSHGVIQSP